MHKERETENKGTKMLKGVGLCDEVMGIYFFLNLKIFVLQHFNMKITNQGQKSQYKQILYTMFVLDAKPPLRTR